MSQNAKSISLLDFSSELASRVDDVYASAEGSLAFYLLQNVDLLQVFLEDLKRELFFGKNLGREKSNFEGLARKVEWLESHVVNVLKEEKLNQETILLLVEVIKKLLSLRAYLIVREKNVMSVLYFLGYYLDRAVVSLQPALKSELEEKSWKELAVELGERAVKFLRKYRLPALSIKSDPGDESLGGGFNLEKNVVEIYADNPYVHFMEDLVNYVVIHEVGHYYFSFLREVFYVLRSLLQETKEENESLILAEAVKKNLKDFEGWISKVRDVFYLNLFEDFRIEKLISETFYTSSKYFEKLKDHFLKEEFEKRKKFQKEFSLKHPEVFLNEESRRVFFIRFWGFFCRFLAFPEVYSVTKEELDLLKKFFTENVLVKGIDDEFFNDLLRTIKEYCSAYLISDGVKVIEAFLKRWFSDPNLGESINESLGSGFVNDFTSEVISEMSRALRELSEESFGSAEASTVESSEESLETVKEREGQGLGEAEEGSEEEREEGERRAGKGKEEEKEETLGESWVEEKGEEESSSLEEVSGSSKDGKEGKLGKEKERSSFSDFARGADFEGESFSSETLKDFVERVKEQLEKETKRSVEEAEKALEDLQKNLKHSGKRIEYKVGSHTVKEYFGSSSGESSGEGAGAGFLSSIEKWFDVAIEGTERFFLTSSDLLKKPEVLLNDAFFNLMKKHYCEGVAFARRIRSLYHKQKEQELWENESGGRISVKAFVKENAKLAYQREKGLVNTKIGRFFLQEEEKERDTGLKKVDVVIDTSGSMSVVAKHTLQTASFLMGISDGLFDLFKSKDEKVFFRFFAVKGEGEDYLFDFTKFLQNKGLVRKSPEGCRYSYHGLFLLRLLAFDGSREGFSAYVEPFLKFRSKGGVGSSKKRNVKDELYYENLPFLTFVVTDGHFVSWKDWEVIKSLKDERLFLTCGLYCTESPNVQIERNLTMAFDGYFVSNPVALKGFVGDFLKIFFAKKKFDLKELKNAVNKIKGSGEKYRKLLEFAFSS